MVPEQTPGGRKRAGSSGARDHGGRCLVIVESPAKARTIGGYLGPGYVVESSIGHVRDLPRSADEVPAQVRGESWARLGVDVDHDFRPVYVVTRDRREQVRRLKSLLADADELLLATDEDREGEAIAWHLLEVLQPKVPVRRMVFHEITEQAIAEAVANPRALDRALVDAQETRRILDRLYGYEVSPVLWKKIQPKLSAGRVQSVATRLVVDRERARMRFRSATYWSLEAIFGVDGDDATVPAALVAVDGARVARGSDFDADTGLPKREVLVLDGETAQGLAHRLATATATVRSVERKPYTRKPYAPFMTSTLQQEAGRKLRFAAERTMRTAQRLYENGHITYMRTDSVHLSETAVAAARAAARDLFGDAYVPDAPRRYTGKVKNAQEAHEAIRPAGESFRSPQAMVGVLDGDELRLYELIWRRTVACQMADAKGQSVSVRIAATSSAGEHAEFAASGRTISFPGFLRAYVEGTDEVREGEAAERDDQERRLPDLQEGQELRPETLTPREHATTPPARYTEATLVRALEERGIGRPSTYASILKTIQDRGYVWRKGSALVPSWTAFAVVALLEQHFERLVDYGFTAAVEDDLDEIAGGARRSVDWLRAFYFGGEATTGLKDLVSQRLGEIDARGVNSIPLHVDEDGVTLVVRVGRYGPYVQRGEDGERASIPPDLAPDELDRERVAALLTQPAERVLGPFPAGGDVVVRTGRYGPYVTVVAPPAAEPEPAAAAADPAPAKGGRRTKAAAKAAPAAKPPTASLFGSMTPDGVTLEEALRLLSLPRVVGVDPADSEPVTAQNGRYGPFVKKGTESRSLDSEDRIFTVTLEEALAILAQPRTRRGATPAAPLRELGEDPVSGKPVTLRSGRFGPYVTDGETNASLRAGDDPETVTPDRAAELLADRRARGPAKPRAKSTPRSTAKSGTAKSGTAKSGTAKSGTAKSGTAKSGTGRSTGKRPTAD